LCAKHTEITLKQVGGNYKIKAYRGILGHLNGAQNGAQKKSDDRELQLEGLKPKAL